MAQQNRNEARYIEKEARLLIRKHEERTKTSVATLRPIKVKKHEEMSSEVSEKV